MPIDDEEIAQILEGSPADKPAPIPETPAPSEDDWTGPRPDTPREFTNAPARGIMADLPTFLIGLFGIMLLFSLAIWCSLGDGASYLMVLAATIAFAGLFVIFWGGLFLLVWGLNRLTGGRLNRWMELVPEPPGWVRAIGSILTIFGRWDSPILKATSRHRAARQ